MFGEESLESRLTPTTATNITIAPTNPEINITRASSSNNNIRPAGIKTRPVIFITTNAINVR